MAMTGSATRKRVYNEQSEVSPPWRSSPFAPFTNFGLATGSEMGTPPFEKRLRTEKKAVPTFKWEPDVPGNTLFSAGYGFRDVKVKTPLPTALQEQPSRGYSTPPQVWLSREKYDGVKQELMQRSSWFPKLDNAAMLAEDALDKVGRPRYGLNFTLGPTQSYYQKYVDAKRELEDSKPVARTVNSWVPLSSNGTSPAFSSLEKMRRRGSNLPQGPMNLYDIQDVLAKKSRWGGGQWKALNPVWTSWSSAKEREMGSLEAVWKSWRSAKEREIGSLEERLSQIRIRREKDEVRRQKEKEASKKEEVLEQKGVSEMAERVGGEVLQLRESSSSVTGSIDSTPTTFVYSGWRMRQVKSRNDFRISQELFKEDAYPNDELQAAGAGPESSSQPVAASIELLDHSITLQR